MGTWREIASWFTSHSLGDWQSDDLSLGAFFSFTQWQPVEAPWIQCLGAWFTVVEVVLLLQAWLVQVQSLESLYLVFCSLLACCLVSEVLVFAPVSWDVLLPGTLEWLVQTHDHTCQQPLARQPAHHRQHPPPCQPLSCFAANLVFIRMPCTEYCQGRPRRSPPDGPRFNCPRSSEADVAVTP